MQRVARAVVVWSVALGLIVFGLAGCGKKPPSEPTQTKSTVSGGGTGTGGGGGATGPGRGSMMKSGTGGGAGTGAPVAKGR